MRMPNLGALRVFEVAARLGSFVAAGIELNVTHGAISKQIQSLERELAASLFERRNRGVHLTPRGTWLADRLSALFADIDRTMRDFHDGDDRTPLTVSCEPTLCLRMLIPAVAALKEETGLDVRVLAAGGSIDFRKGRVDVAIRRSDFPLPPGVTAKVLVDEWMGPVVAPGPTDRGGGLHRLHSATRPDAWRNWDARQGTETARGSDIHYEHFYLSIQAAEAGQGKAMASLHMVADDLAAGRLVAPDGFMLDGTRYLALTPSGLANPRVTRFTQWLTHRLHSSARMVRVAA